MNWKVTYLYLYLDTDECLINSYISALLNKSYSLFSFPGKSEIVKVIETRRLHYSAKEDYFYSLHLKSNLCRCNWGFFCDKIGHFIFLF